MKYQIKVFVAGLPGYFLYEVGDNKEQALDHFTNIARDGYRRLDDRGQIVHYFPRMIDKIILAGEDLELSGYPDKLITT